MVFVYYSSTISSIMTAASMTVMDRRCIGVCAASSLLIGVCICDVGECEVRVRLFFCFDLFFLSFLHETMTVLTRC